jgi:hypothetical protein
MLTLIYLLILFFTILIVYPFLSCLKTKDYILSLDSFNYFRPVRFKEGYENNNYKPYDKTTPENALILAQQNAGNIEVLKGQLGDVMDIRGKVNDLSGAVDNLQETVDGLVQAQKDYVNDLNGGVEPQITGAVEEEEE